MRSSIINSGLALLLFACASQPAVVSSQSSAVAEPPEISTFVIPVHASLAPLLPLIEAQVPKQLIKVDAFEMDKDQRFGLKYKAMREPIVLTMIGTGLHATTTVHYALEGCTRTVNPLNGKASMWPCLSCGFGEPMRDAWIAIDSHLEWDMGWTLRSRTTARPVEFPNRCTVTFFNLDITDRKIAPLVNEQLRDVARTIDRNVPRMGNLRANAEQVWSSLSVPAPIAPRTWLTLEPLDVTVGPMRGNGLDVVNALVLRARTRVIVGEKPSVTATPLPSLKNANYVTGSIRVPFTIELPYAEASRLAGETFANRSYKVSGGTLAISSLKLAPAADGKLSIIADIDYRAGGLKNYRGAVFLEGTPAFDSASSRVALTGLDYSIDPKRRNLFLRTANRLAHESVRAQLATSASWLIGDQLTALRGEITKAMSRNLGANVVMRGGVDAIEPRRVEVTREGIVLHVVATGHADIEVR